MHLIIFAICRPPTFVADFHDKDSVSEMVHNKLGNTDMIVSKMTFGKLYSIFQR